MNLRMKWFWFRFYLVRLSVDVRCWIAPEYSHRRLKRRFAELPDVAKRVLLERHGNRIP